MRALRHAEVGAPVRVSARWISHTRQRLCDARPLARCEQAWDQPGVSSAGPRLTQSIGSVSDDMQMRAE